MKEKLTKTRTKQTDYSKDLDKQRNKEKEENKRRTTKNNYQSKQIN